MVKEIAFVGLGRMGLSLAKRAIDNGFTVYGWNRGIERRNEAKKYGIKTFSNINILLNNMKDKPKTVWLMLPAGEVTEVYFKKVLSKLRKNDIIIDGANSHFSDSLRRAKECKKKGVKFLDIGVSGGLHGFKRGFCLMVGGDKSVYNYCKDLFTKLAAENGEAYIGKNGTGHYVKMVHNAIEYGMMQAIAEGFQLLKEGMFSDIDIKKVARLWNNGSIIESFLIEQTYNGLKHNGNQLNKIEPYVEDNKEGLWAVEEALKHNIAFIVNSIALNQRFVSRGKSDYAFKLLAAMRNEFGGHKIKKK